MIKLIITFIIAIISSIIYIYLIRLIFIRIKCLIKKEKFNKNLVIKDTVLESIINKIKIFYINKIKKY